jgi:hypothetical protein
MKALRRAAQSDDELLELYEDADTLRKRWNLLAHSVAMVGTDLRGDKLYLYWHPKTDEEATLYPHDLLAAAKDIEAMCARLHRAARERSWSQCRGL